MDFNTYLKNRQQKTQQLVEKSNQSTQSYDDNRFWKPTLDKEKGVGGAIIRFLPVVDNSTLDYVEYRNYAFQWKDTGRWYIENSPYTFKQPDPVYDLRNRLYKTQNEIDKALATSMRLNTTYIANILVVNDPAHPENNGKVFLYKYNKTIQGLIDTALKPEPDPLTGTVAESMNAFDLLEGANLEIRFSAGTGNGWNYEKTKWSAPAPIVNNEQEFNNLTSKVYNLSEFIDPSKFKSYEDLAKRLAYVIDADYIGSGVKVLTNGTVASMASTVPQKATPTPKQESAPAKTESQFEEYNPPWLDSNEPLVENNNSTATKALEPDFNLDDFDFS